MVRGSGGQNRVFNLASDTWHKGVVSKAGCFREKRKHHEKVLHSETLYLLEGKKNPQMSFKVGQNATYFL